MSAYRTFRKGGVHPPEAKFAAGVPSAELPLPAQVLIPLRQHLGAPAIPLVAAGDHVLTGQLLASANDFISANVHSSVTGVVEDIKPMPDLSGIPVPMIIIRTEPDQWIPSVKKEADDDLPPDPFVLLDKIRQAGIVGMGGAAFPSHVKLTVPRGKSVDTLIINGAECEPCLSSDHRLMLERPVEILRGISVMMKALNLNHAILGVERNKEDAALLLRQKAESLNLNIAVVLLKVKYPQGAEKMLIRAATGRKVPSGALPLEAGCIVHNVSTAFAVYETVFRNRPLTERVVTLVSLDGAVCKNYLVRLGTPVAHLLEQAGISPQEFRGKVIAGGPMMGKAVAALSAPVTKGTSGIVLMGEPGSFRSAEENCIRCARCVSVCPMGLEPYILQQMVFAARYEDVLTRNLSDCMECGSCQYVCPSSRPLLDYIRKGKVKTMEMIRNKKSL